MLWICPSGGYSFLSSLFIGVGRTDVLRTLLITSARLACVAFDEPESKMATPVCVCVRKRGSVSRSVYGQKRDSLSSCSLARKLISLTGGVAVEEGDHVLDDGIVHFVQLPHRVGILEVEASVFLLLFICTCSVVHGIEEEDEE